ncbi:Scr1 family TA system antitoxin-like transcriptional regulator [Streptomyces sp. NPDC000594]|uniref:Scr1 family TA system antitoxin-like transcriptional regulator n=1 Tax=Streptomyces sp. NPDC000594 TaxID=3154261 RepID=UPI00332BB280
MKLALSSEGTVLRPADDARWTGNVLMVPSAGAQMAGTYLRAQRRRRGLLLRDVARLLGWTTAATARLEAGQTVASADTLQRLLTAYGVPGTDEAVRALWGLAHVGGDYAADVAPGWFERVAACEFEADRITAFSAWNIPHLVQTEGYATHWWTSTPVGHVPPPDTIAARAVPADHDKEVLLLLEEPVLLRRSDPAVMTEQLDHLLHLAENTRTSVRIVPLHAGVVPPHGTLTVLELPNRRCLHVEEATATIYSTGRPAARLQYVIDSALAAALPRDTSLDLIRRTRAACAREANQ